MKPVYGFAQTNNNSMDERFSTIEVLMYEYDNDDKFVMFAKYYLQIARHAPELDRFGEACQVTKDLLILDEDLDGIGFDQLVEVWEEALDIKYGRDYACRYDNARERVRVVSI